MNFGRKKKKDFLGDINVTPLIDMMFILLIFLMISTTFKTPEQSFILDLPTAGKTEVTVTKGVPTIYVTKNGKILFYDPKQDSKPRPITMDNLKTAFKSIADRDPKTPVSIRGEASARIQSLVDVVNAAYQAGLTKVQLPYTVKQK
jgi:biopolymer transport protein ExbD